MYSAWQKKKKTDTKVKPGLNKYSPVDHEMALRAQELAPSGIMLRILSLKASIYSKVLELLASKRIWSNT